jgi:alkylated DNA repair dioxygenase AlkB
MTLRPDVVFEEEFVPNADALYTAILTQTTWDDRMHARLTASFGAPYNYSNMTYPAVEMPTYFQEVCDAIYSRLGFLPNNCLINNYIEGSSKMGFHADNVEELVPRTGVAIVSLGETRSLTFRRTVERDVRWDCPLPHGSLLYMSDTVQAEWQHGVLPKPSAGQRISLTFRALK